METRLDAMLQRSGASRLRVERQSGLELGSDEDV